MRPLTLVCLALLPAPPVKAGSPNPIQPFEKRFIPWSKRASLRTGR